MGLTTMLLDTFLSTEMGQTLLAQADGDEGAEESDSKSDGELDVIDKFLVQAGQVSQRTLKPRAARRLKGMVKLPGEVKPHVDRLIDVDRQHFSRTGESGKGVAHGVSSNGRFVLRLESYLKGAAYECHSDARQSCGLDECAVRDRTTTVERRETRRSNHGTLPCFLEGQRPCAAALRSLSEGLAPFLP